jgi:hypothetical protein
VSTPPETRSALDVFFGEGEQCGDLLVRTAAGDSRRTSISRGVKASSVGCSAISARYFRRHPPLSAGLDGTRGLDIPYVCIPGQKHLRSDVLKLIEQAVADGAALITQQGDAGIDKAQRFGWETARMWSAIPISGFRVSSTRASTSGSWWFTIARTIWCLRSRALEGNSR